MKIILTLLIPFCYLSGNFAQTTISGTITEENYTTPIAYASVVLYRNDVWITATETNEKGEFYITNFDSGKYDLQISTLGYSTRLIKDVFIRNDAECKIKLNVSGWDYFIEWVIIGYEIPLIETDNLTSGQTFFDYQIRRFASSTNN